MRRAACGYGDEVFARAAVLVLVEGVAAEKASRPVSLLDSPVERLHFLPAAFALSGLAEAHSVLAAGVSLKNLLRAAGEREVSRARRALFFDTAAPSVNVDRNAQRDNGDHGISLRGHYLPPV